MQEIVSGAPDCKKQQLRRMKKYSLKQKFLAEPHIPLRK